MKIARTQGLILEAMNKANIKDDKLLETLEDIEKISDKELIEKLDQVPEKFWTVKYTLMKLWLIYHERSL